MRSSPQCFWSILGNFVVPFTRLIPYLYVHFHIIIFGNERNYSVAILKVFHPEIPKKSQPLPFIRLVHCVYHCELTAGQNPQHLHRPHNDIVSQSNFIADPTRSCACHCVIARKWISLNTRLYGMSHKELLIYCNIALHYRNWNGKEITWHDTLI